MRAWWIGSLLLFVAIVVAVLVQLSGDYMPARHIDREFSWFATTDAGAARLHLVVEDVASDAMIETAERVLDDGTIELNLRATTRPARAPQHDGTVELVIDYPATTPAVLVLDRRWAHAREHPQGLHLERRAAAPTAQQ